MHATSVNKIKEKDTSYSMNTKATSSTGCKIPENAGIQNIVFFFLSLVLYLYNIPNYKEIENVN